jgi:tetratricopeptide (TPR) repeat protein
VLRQLREDVYRTFMLLGALRLRPVLMMKSDDPLVLDACRSTLEAIELLHHFRPSFSGRLVERFCYLRLGQLHRVLTLKSVSEPTSAADYYFAGIAHVWLAAAAKDDSIRRLLEHPLIRAFGGLDFQKARQTSERYLRAAADREPKHYWTQFWLAWSFGVLDDFPAAAQAFDTCVALRPDYGLAYAERGRMLIARMLKTSEPDQRRDLEQRGLADLQRAQSLDPDEPHIHWLRAECQSYLGRVSEALEAHARAMELERPVTDWEGQHLGEQKQYLFQQAANFAKTVVEKDPGQVEAWANLGSAEIALGHLAEARTAAGRALQLRAEHAHALAVRGDVHLQEKQFEPALADFQRALSSAPRYYVSAAGIAKAYLALNRFEESLAAFDHLLTIAGTDWQRVEAHRGRAHSLMRLGRRDEARGAQESAQDMDPRAGKTNEMP